METPPNLQKLTPRRTRVTVRLTPKEIARLDAVKCQSETRWGISLRSRAEALRLLLHLGSDPLFKKPTETGGPA
jgi:predicted SPOUT superfamily RNA methylase MTH1